MTRQLTDIELEDLPENFRDIAEVIGMEAIVALLKLCGGQNIYFPKLENITQPARYRQIYEEYQSSRSGKVNNDLAKKYNYSESHVRTIIRQEQRRRQSLIGQA